MPASKILAGVSWLVLWFALLKRSVVGDEAAAGARVVSFYGHDDCLCLENDHTRVMLCPAAGGRVLEYALDGVNGLYLPPGDEGWTYEPGKRGGSMHAGRFDIGPEQIVPKRPLLWMGRWKGEIIGPRERIAPGESASFTETWWLLPRSFPKEGEQVNLSRVAAQVAEEAR